MMCRRRSIAIAAVAALLAWGSASTAQAAKVVDISDDFFAPQFLKIKQKKTVAFNWVGSNDHNVYRHTGPGKYFDSGVMQGEGVLYSRKFRKPGRYVLGCILHEEMLMDLKVKRRR